MDHETTALSVRAEGTDRELLETVIAFYRNRLKECPQALGWLQDRGLTDPELLDAFELGYADRALARTLPNPQLKAGKRIRDQLQRTGILRPTGHGHFNGCLVVPIRNAEGEVIQMYGRKIGRHLRGQKTLHVTSSPLGAEEDGVLWNVGALATEDIVLTDSIINGLTLWSAGLRNAVALPNVAAILHGNDFTDAHLAIFKASTVRRLSLAFRNTGDGNRAADVVASRLTSAGLAVDHITFPPGLDANDYIRREGPEALERLTNVAEQWAVGSGQDKDEGGRMKDERKESGDGNPQSEIRIPQSDIPQSAIRIPQSDDFVVTFADRRYRVRGLDANTGLDRLKVNLLVSRDDLVHVDTLDLYAARSRNAFIKQASGEIYIEEETIRRDLAKILLKLETLQEERMQERLTSDQGSQPTMTDAERDEALALLHDPRLLDRVTEDFARCGLVGEETNQRVCYLACVSCRLPTPLAVMIQSGSGSGKTALMDRTLAFMPPEDRIQYSAMTGQSLYYMGPRNMKHKILAVSEEEGVAQAAYALKLLQSDGRLRIAAAEKDGDTGRQKTHDYEVEGPVMMFLTTTAQSPDPELQSRCLTLRVNESEAQTAAILARQRADYTLSGQGMEDARQAITALHQNAQRLLATLPVVIPWADRLTFRCDQATSRRDHGQYLTLIAASALLHQYQRRKKTRQVNGVSSNGVASDGQPIEYIEATLEDVEIANQLAGQTLGQSLDGLLPRTRNLLERLNTYVTRRAQQEEKKRADVRFTQRELRETLGWCDRSLRRHLWRLVELEYVLVYRTGRGNGREYQLLYDGEGREGRPFLLGLVDTAKLKSEREKPQYDDGHEQNPTYDGRNGGQKGRTGTHSAPIRHPSGGLPAPVKNDVTPGHESRLQQMAPAPSQNGTQDVAQTRAS